MTGAVEESPAAAPLVAGASGRTGRSATSALSTADCAAPDPRTGPAFTGESDDDAVPECPLARDPAG